MNAMEVVRQTAGMEEIIVDAAGNIAYEFTQEELSQHRFYTNDYAAVGYKYETGKDEIVGFVRCIYPEYLDVITLTCIAESELGSEKFIRGRLAVAKCGPGMFYFENHCVDACPAADGYYFDGSVNENNANECKQITEGYVYNGQQNATCSKLSYLKGCFDVCPDSLVESGHTCELPQAASECGERYFIREDDHFVCGPLATSPVPVGLVKITGADALYYEALA